MTFQNHTLLTFILQWVVSGLAVLLTSKLVAGFKVRGFVSACAAAFVVALVNYVLWYLLQFLALPLTIITFGLFFFVVNGALLKIAAAIMPGFKIETWWAAIFGAIVLAIVNWALHALLI